MKVKDLRDKTVEELEKEILTIREDQFKLKMQKSTGQLGQSHLLRQARRDIARVKTVIKEKAGE